MQGYKCTQKGYVTIPALSISLLIIVKHMVDSGFNLFGFVISLFLTCCLLLFPTLTVSISSKEIKLWFGLGYINTSIDAADIVSCRRVRNKWYCGWGIRRINAGWLYTVSGLDAVEVSLKDNSVCRIGTSRPKELADAIGNIIQ